MKAVLSKSNGMQHGVMDAELMRFWPIEEWLAEPKSFVTFADWSISAHEYAWHTTNGQVALVGGDVPLIVAPSMDEFLQYYLDEPMRMFG